MFKLDQYGNEYEPTQEELAGESYQSCYEQSVVIVPPKEEKIDEHHQ